MKKKFSLGLLAACLLTGVLAACGGPDNGNSSSQASSENNSSSLSSSYSSELSNSSSLTSQGVSTSSHLPSSSSILPPSSSSSSQASSSSSQASSSSSQASSSSKSSSSQAPFSFTLSLATGSNILNKGVETRVVINASGGDPSVNRKYSYSNSDKTVIDVTRTGVVTALAKGEAKITVVETVSKVARQLTVTVVDASLAEGGYNFASLAGQEAINRRTEILGKLEKDAMDNHLTGITLFENGGYVKYSSRVTLPTTNYITGYGFGLLQEGTIDNDSINHEEKSEHKMYLHSAISQDPAKINARNDTGAQVSDLEGYITASYWGTKLNSTKDSYEWYPVLAKDTVTYNGNTSAFNRPIPVYQGEEVKPGAADPNPLGLYTTWRIYVKTGSSVQYRYNGKAWEGYSFERRSVALEDYEFAYRFLLTGSHNQVRGTEMAGDSTYGIVGAQRYNTNTKDVTDEIALQTWQEMTQNGELGIKTDNDPVNGAYIQLELLNPIDRFTAMYTLSSNLVSPMPEDFLKAIGGGSVKVGASKYGQTNNGSIVDYTLSVGPYMLESWDIDASIAFKRNETWVEPGRYHIAGIKLIAIDTGTDSSAVYKRFNLGDLDSCGIPIKFINTEVGQPRVYETKGDSTFKLNVNSCDQTTWNYLFGENGKINKNSSWDLKPWMNNDNFLKGLFYSINRKEFASNRGSQPSIDYFSNAYLSDPERGVSYNSTQAHADAVAAYQTYDSDGNSTYGYSYDKAVLSFKAAVDELVTAGKLQYNQDIEISITWMYYTNIEEYGNAIAKYFTDAFNDPRVSNGQIHLNVKQSAVQVWDQVYNEVMMKGQFDLAFGAISGNTYNPLNFLQVLKSDNESGFTLNWGTDTSKVNSQRPLIYNDNIWSFDALWACADHGGVVKAGEIAKTVELCYLDGVANELYTGGAFDVVTNFIDSEYVQVEIQRIQIYIFGFGGTNLSYNVDTNGNVVTSHISITKAQAEQIDADIRRVNHMDDDDKYHELYKEHAFTYQEYNKLWTIEVSYNLRIKQVGDSEFGLPTLSYAAVSKNLADAIAEKD